MARVEGQEPGPGQKSKANGPRRLTPATEDTDISYWISLELGTVWEMFPTGSGAATAQGWLHSPELEGREASQSQRQAWEC